MNWLIACEESAVVRDALRARGHNAVSCDLQPTRGDPSHHHVGDVRDLLRRRGPDGRSWWHGLIAFPPCTYIASSGLHWNSRTPGRAEKTDAAVALVVELMESDIPRKAIENPVGCLSTRIREPDQIIHPWQFGHEESKTTCLWLENLPLLRPTIIVSPDFFVWPDGRIFEGEDAELDVLAREGVLTGRWRNQTASGQNKLSPSPTRARARSETYPGIAAAFADQWGRLRPEQIFKRQLHRQALLNMGENDAEN